MFGVLTLIEFYLWHFLRFFGFLEVVFILIIYDKQNHDVMVTDLKS